MVDATAAPGRQSLMLLSSADHSWRRSQTLRSGNSRRVFPGRKIAVGWMRTNRDEIA
jgi:hypothetical protein